MGRPKSEKHLVDKVAEAFAKVGKIPRNGRNKTRNYPFTYASDVLDAVRLELLGRGVLIHISEDKPEYSSVAQSNGGAQITECRLGVTYTFLDRKDKIEPMRFNGVGRDVEDKSLYKAQTGAQKALLKRFGLMAEEADDPECDQAAEAPVDHAQQMREAAAPQSKPQKTVTISQIHTFTDACRETGKSQDEVSGYLLTTHQVSKLADLGRGRPFTQALTWAKHKPEGLALAPKAQPALAMQPRLPLPAPPIEMKIGNKTVTVEPKSTSYAL